MNKAEVLSQREIISGRAINAFIGVLFFALATAFGAYVRIPVPGSPVPITLQTFFVILSGAVLGKKLGATSQLGYVALGLAGFSVFQGIGSGGAYLAGPTGGYLFGFICASYMIGRMTASHHFTLKRAVFSFAAGNAVILAFGTTWLMYLLKIDIGRAVLMGTIPFIIPDLVKSLVAAIIYSKIERRLRDIFRFT